MRWLYTAWAEVSRLLLILKLMTAILPVGFLEPPGFNLAVQWHPGLRAGRTPPLNRRKF